MVNQTRIIIIIILTTLLFSSFVIAEVSPSDKTQIQKQITLIAKSINNNEINSIIKLISPNARSTLKGEIKNELVGKTIQFQQSISSYEELGNNQIKVKGRYSASGPGWSINGISNFYFFEKSGDSWLLVDTDFHQKMGVRYVFKFVGIILLIILLFLLIFGAFWLWMLIDCIGRQFEDKIMWILLIIFFNIIGAILYFFMIRKKLIRQGKNKRRSNKNAR